MPLSNENAASPTSPDSTISELEIELIEGKAAVCEAKRWLVDTQARSYPILVISLLVILASFVVVGATSG